MSENTPNTTTELQINNWTYTSSGNVPVGFTVPTPTAIVTTDDDFEITTVTLSFAGTAPSGQNDFSLNYSFSVPKSGNMVDLKISSDDTASVTAASKTANSTLHTDGWARSDWIQSPTETETQITGTFETIGGPYDLTVTVMIVRSLSGKVYGVDLTPTIVTRSVENAYEITTATITISGNAPSGNFAFTANNSFNIPGGNWVEITASSDDSAIITVDELSATSTLHASANVTSDWIESPPETIPVSVSFTNGGGPFSLNLTITTKRALVEMFFLTEKLSGKNELALIEDETSSDEEKALFRQRNLRNRNKFGCGETVYVKFRYIASQIELSGIPDIAIFSTEYIEDTSNGKLRTRYIQDMEGEVSVMLNGEVIIKKDFSIVIPHGEWVEKEVCNDLENAPFTPEESGVYDAKCLTVSVRSNEVNFSHLYFWEVGTAGETAGFVKNYYGDSFPHYPEPPTHLTDANLWIDWVYLCLNETDVENCFIYYASQQMMGNSSFETWTEEDDRYQISLIGTLIWTCPVRWSFDNPGQDLRSEAECKEENIPKNATLPYDGILPTRVQTMEVHHVIDTETDVASIQIQVEKNFPYPPVNS